jgi:hypothetical protein
LGERHGCGGYWVCCGAGDGRAPESAHWPGLGRAMAFGRVQALITPLLQVLNRVARRRPTHHRTSREAIAGRGGPAYRRLRQPPRAGLISWDCQVGRSDRGRNRRTRRRIGSCRGRSTPVGIAGHRGRRRRGRHPGPGQPELPGSGQHRRDQRRRGRRKRGQGRRGQRRPGLPRAVRTRFSRGRTSRSWRSRGHPSRGCLNCLRTSTSPAWACPSWASPDSVILPDRPGHSGSPQTANSTGRRRGASGQMLAPRRRSGRPERVNSLDR